MSVNKTNKKDKSATQITSQGYSFGFKLQVLAEVENGQLSINQAAKKYGVSRSGIQKWMQQLGTKEKKLRGLQGKSPAQAIKDLRKQIKDLEMREAILESAIEILEEEYGIDVKKKVLARIGTKFTERTGKKMNVQQLTSVFGLTRQGYYQFKKRAQNHQINHGYIIRRVGEIRQEMPRIGTRKLHRLLKEELEERQIKIGRDALFTLLRKELMLVQKRKNYTRTTQSYHRFNKHPNLLKDKEIERPEQAWVSDITYIRTKKGFMYLSLITDAYSRKIVGYKLSDNLKTESTLKALKMALQQRIRSDKELIHHSDRGLQYCSPVYTEALEKHSIQISMTTKYDPYENAIAERVNGILKNEFYLDTTFKDAKQATKVVQQSIRTYNEKRPHLSLNYQTPDTVHRQAIAEAIERSNEILKGSDHYLSKKESIFNKK